jgi:hypothetical protein
MLMLQAMLNLARHRKNCDIRGVLFFFQRDPHEKELHQQYATVDYFADWCLSTACATS